MRHTILLRVDGVMLAANRFGGHRLRLHAQAQLQPCVCDGLLERGELWGLWSLRISFDSREPLGWTS